MNSTSPYDVLICGLLGVEYALWLDAAPRGGTTCAIERETREAGGIALLTALELAGRGARVALTGNAIGDDSNGRVVLRALEQPNLSCFAPCVASVETPYWVSLQTPNAKPSILSRWSTVDFDPALVETISAKVFACDEFWLRDTPRTQGMFDGRGTTFAAAKPEETAGQWADRIWALMNKRE
ncbi:MAG TPA: hypothetical protein VF681_02510 [Abditibacteriaceae bacterium]